MNDKTASQPDEVEALDADALASIEPPRPAFPAPPPPPPRAFARRNSGIRPPPPPPPPPARARASQDLSYEGALAAPESPSKGTAPNFTSLELPVDAPIGPPPPAPPAPPARALAPTPPRSAVPTPPRVAPPPPPAPRPPAVRTAPEPAATGGAAAAPLSDPLAFAAPLATAAAPPAPLAPPRLSFPPRARASTPPAARNPGRWRGASVALGACVLALAAAAGVAWQFRPSPAPAAALPPPETASAVEEPPSAPVAPTPALPAPAADNTVAPVVAPAPPGRNGVRASVPGAGRVAAAATPTPSPSGRATAAAPASQPTASGGSCVQRCGGNVDCIMRCPRDSLRAASASPPAGSTSAPGASVAASGAGPTREQVLMAMNGVRGGVLLCAMGLANAPPTARVSVTFGASGQVLGVAVAPPFAGTPQGACIQRAVRRASVPPFQRPTFVVAFPFAVH